MQIYMHTVNGALRALTPNQEIGTMTETATRPTSIPVDITVMRDGFYTSVSNPSIVWINPAEILASLGEPPSFDMIGALTSAIEDSYAQHDIEIIVIDDL